MNPHPRDNPVWEALRTHHARFALREGRAVRYDCDVALFVAVSDADPATTESLARLMAPGEQLTEVHLSDMLELTTLVYPAYFRPRTPAMGRYVGIYDGPRLAAMAGERMHPGSWCEVSAMCPHPDYLGRGLARQLMAEVCETIVRRGETPFLHVSRANARAKTLYDRLGFVERSATPYWQVRRPVADAINPQ